MQDNEHIPRQFIVHLAAANGSRNISRGHILRPPRYGMGCGAFTSDFTTPVKA